MALPLIFRARDVPLLRSQLRAMVHSGELYNPWRGIYVRSDAPLTGRQMAAFALRRPDAVFGLLTALSHHELTDWIPRRLDVFIPYTTPSPRFSDIPCRVIRQQSHLLEVGIEPWSVLGVETWIVSPSRAVADAFRFSRHVSLQVAIDALEVYLEDGHPIGELIDTARQLRTYNRLLPYLRALQ